MLKPIIKVPRTIIDACYMRATGHKAPERDVRLIKAVGLIGGAVFGLILIALDLALSLQNLDG